MFINNQFLKKYAKTCFFIPIVISQTVSTLAIYLNLKHFKKKKKCTLNHIYDNLERENQEIFVKFDLLIKLQKFLKYWVELYIYLSKKAVNW